MDYGFKLLTAVTTVYMSGRLFKYYYTLRRHWNQHQISLSTTLDILKQFKYEMYPVFSELQKFSQSIKQQYTARMGYLPQEVEDNIKQIIYSNNSTCMQHIRQIEAKICTQYNVSDISIVVSNIKHHINNTQVKQYIEYFNATTARCF